MPPVSRPMIPFVGERFDPRTRLGDYARQSARDTAESIRRGGDLSAQMWQGIGQNVSGTLRDIAAYPDQQRARQRQETLIQREEQAYQAAEQAQQAEAAKAQRLQELVKEHGWRVPSDRLLQEFGPKDAADISKAFDQMFPAPKEEESYTLNPGDVRFKGGQKIAEVPKPEPVKEPERVTFGAPTPAMVGGRRVFVRTGSDGKTYDMRGGVLEGDPAPIPPQSAAPGTPDQAFVIRNGQVTPITKGTAQPGDVPYSADAMQGMGGEASDARSMRTAAALNAIDKLKSLAPNRMPGLPGMVQGAAAKVQGLAGYNTGARQYEALLQPTAMQMAVAIQGAAGLSNSEREAMARTLGNIATMDYETQMALLENASQLVRGGADVRQVTMKDPKTGQPVTRWVPARSRIPGSVAVGDSTAPGVLPGSGGFSPDNPFAQKPKS